MSGLVAGIHLIARGLWLRRQPLTPAHRLELGALFLIAALAVLQELQR
jgi:hypothetical protein